MPLEVKKIQGRYVAVIGGYPLYRSTGKNSGSKDTWFPFQGFFPKSSVPLMPSFIKPAHSSYEPGKLSFYKNYPQYVIDFFKREFSEKEAENYLARFGNFKALCLSALFGGGFWETPNGEQLKNRLREQYRDQWLQYEGTFLDQVTQCRNFMQTEAVVDDIQIFPQRSFLRRGQYEAVADEKRKDANQWLINQGAKIAYKPSRTEGVEAPCVDFDMDFSSGAAAASILQSHFVDRVVVIAGIVTFGLFKCLSGSEGLSTIIRLSDLFPRSSNPFF